MTCAVLYYTCTPYTHHMYWSKLYTSYTLFIHSFIHSFKHSFTISYTILMLYYTYTSYVYMQVILIAVTLPLASLHLTGLFLYFPPVR